MTTSNWTKLEDLSQVRFYFSLFTFVQESIIDAYSFMKKSLFYVLKRVELLRVPVKTHASNERSSRDTLGVGDKNPINL